VGARIGLSALRSFIGPALEWNLAHKSPLLIMTTELMPRVFLYPPEEYVIVPKYRRRYQRITEPFAIQSFRFALAKNPVATVKIVHEQVVWISQYLDV